MSPAWTSLQVKDPAFQVLAQSYSGLGTTNTISSSSSSVPPPVINEDEDDGEVENTKL